MPIQLEKASIEDANEIHALQVESFLPLLEKYQDYETNPANERVEQILNRFQQPRTTYYFITLDGARIGAVRAVCIEETKRARISPMFIVPKHQGKGYAQEAISLLEVETDARTWELDTILQDERNCHLYEKMGYRRTGNSKVINDRMTIVSYEKDLGT